MPKLEHPDRFPRGGGVLQVSFDRNDQMGTKIKTQKLPRVSPKKSHADNLSLKKFPERIK